MSDGRLSPCSTVGTCVTAFLRDAPATDRRRVLERIVYSLEEDDLHALLWEAHGAMHRHDIVGNVPEELLLPICTHLSARDMLTMCCVSRAWHRRVSKLHVLWHWHCRCLTIERLSLTRLSEAPGVLSIGDGACTNGGSLAWKQQFLRRRGLLNLLRTSSGSVHAIELRADNIVATAKAKAKDGSVLLVGGGKRSRQLYVWKYWPSRQDAFENLTLRMEQPSNVPQLLFQVEAHICSCIAAGGNLAILGSFDGTASSWSLETGCRQATFQRHAGTVLCVACSVRPDPRGRVVVLTGSTDNTSRVWWDNGECIAVLPHERWVRQVSLCPTFAADPVGDEGADGSGAGGGCGGVGGVGVDEGGGAEAGTGKEARGSGLRTEVSGGIAIVTCQADVLCFWHLEPVAGVTLSPTTPRVTRTLAGLNATALKVQGNVAMVAGEAHVHVFALPNFRPLQSMLRRATLVATEELWWASASSSTLRLLDYGGERLSKLEFPSKISAVTAVDEHTLCVTVGNTIYWVTYPFPGLGPSWPPPAHALPP
eukprot:m.70163 g.70163  ORF g.70163 m.70163 type:complete len:538 (+) comp14042_c1_seq1:223-1836(+)